MANAIEQQISDVVKRFPPEWRPNELHRAPAEVAFSGGGVWKGVCPAGPAALRCWPAGYDPRRVAAIHRLLVTARARGCSLVPQPIADVHGQTLHRHADRLWELCTWMPGEPVRMAPSDAQLRSAMCALASWHACVRPHDLCDPATQFGPATPAAPSPGWCRRVEEWDRLRRVRHLLSTDWIRHHADDSHSLQSRTLRAAERLAPRMEEWLAAPPTVPMSLCLRDVHREHVLFTGVEVSGIVDFGAVGVDTVACDLGRLLGSLVPDDAARWHAAIAHYRQFGELSLPAEQLAWRFDSTGVVIGALHWLEWVEIERRVFAEPAAAQRRWEQLVGRMEHWLDTGGTPGVEAPAGVGIFLSGR